MRATAVVGQNPVQIDFVPEAKRCPTCGAALQVQKSKRRTVATLAHGLFQAREVRKRCEGGACPAVACQELRRLVKPGQRYGYDLISYVGLARYVSMKQRDEIRTALLDEYGIELSAGTISTLCDRFLALLEALHVRRAPQLRAVLQEDNYPLHIDATCERGKGGLFVCLAGWRGWVLWAGRVPSEHVDHLEPLVQRTVGLFGPPVAVVRDMGEGVAGAVKFLHETGIPVLICHYHFASAIGKTLMRKLHDSVRGIIRRTRVRADMRVLLRDLRGYGPCEPGDGRFGSGRVRDDLKVLVLWLLEGNGRKDPPFPFGLPHLEFVRRCRQAVERADAWVPCPRTGPERRATDHLASLVRRLERDQRFAPTVRDLEERWHAFGQLRDVLRLSNAELPRGDTRYQQRQLPALELVRLEQIRQAVDDYQRELETRIPAEDSNKARPKSPPAIILKYLKRHGARLFGHPARFDTQGEVIAVVDRTNNPIERLFGQEKGRLRRRVGRAQVGRDLELQPAQVALVSNLRSPEYVRTLCGSLDHLPIALAELDMQRPPDTVALDRDRRDKDLQRRMKEILNNTECKSNRQPEETEHRNLEAVDLPSRWPELEELTDEEIHARRIAVFAPANNQAPKPRDPRLPPAGSLLERWYKRRVYRVLVLDDGFQLRGSKYETLSPVAKAITSNTSDGFKFFGLTMPWEQRASRMRGRRITQSTLITLGPATES